MLFGLETCDVMILGLTVRTLCSLSYPKRFPKKFVWLLLVSGALVKGCGSSITYLLTCVGIHPGRVEPASPIAPIALMMFHGSLHAEVPSSGVAAVRGFAAQAKLSLPGLRAPERPLFTYTPPFGSNPGDATGTQGIGV